MYILGICDNGDVLSTFKIVNLVILILKIAVPIVLIVSVMIDFAKAVSNHDEINVTNKLFVNKLMAAVLIFCIPTFVNIIVDVLDPNGVSYVGCLNNATTENINKAYYNTAKKYIAEAKKTILRADYMNAKSSVKKIKDESLRKPLEEELVSIENYILISEQIDKVAKEYDREKYLELKKQIDNITDPDVKEKLTEKLREAFKSKGSIAEFDMDPDSSLYSNLKPLSGITLSEVLKNNGSSVEELNQKIQTAVETAGRKTREATVMAGMTLLDEVSNMGYYIFYEWGGKYRAIGVNGDFGTKITPYCEGIDYNFCTSTLTWRGFDCTGFVDWALSQNFNDPNYSYRNGKQVSLSSSQAVCGIGDALENEDHIVLVVGIDEANKRYIVEESTTAGVNRLRLSYKPFDAATYWCDKYDYSN